MSKDELDLDTDSTHVIFIFIITFWTFTIAFYGNLINLCRKTYLIFIQIPLMSYSFLQSHFGHSQSHSMKCWSIFVERRIWYWYRFLSCHIHFYNHILDIYNALYGNLINLGERRTRSWYRFHSCHIHFYNHIFYLHNRILWSADQSVERRIWYSYIFHFYHLFPIHRILRPRLIEIRSIFFVEKWILSYHKFLYFRFASCK